MDSLIDPQIQKLFFGSAERYIQEMNDALLSLEVNPGASDMVETIFRNAHSLKSESLAMGYTRMSEVCHRLEDLFTILRDGQKRVSKTGFGSLFQVIDFLGEAIELLKKGKGEPETKATLELIKALLEGNLVVTEKSEGIEVEELKKPRLENIKVSLRILDHLMNVVEELTIERMRLGEIINKSKYEKLTEFEEKFDFLISDLQYFVTQARLTPIEDIFQNLPRIVRDLTQKLGKKVNVKLDLGNLKVDRFIGETIYEPVLHLIKNALDHGIEDPQERKKMGKREEGTLSLRAYSDRGLAVIEISDDGRGFDIKTARKRLEEKGIKGVQELNEKAVIDLLFEGGISTAKKLTDISGRGIGLNIVESVMLKVGGKARVDTKEGRGTIFTLEFPFTLAIIEAILSKVAGDTYAIPVTNIVKTVIVKREKIQKAADTNVFLLDKEEVMLVCLRDLFEKKKAQESNEWEVVVVSSGKEKLGLVVDEIMELEEIIIKPLEIDSEKTYFSGVTVLGDEKTVLVMDIARLIERFSRH